VTTERIDPLSAVAARPVTYGILAIALALPILTLVSRGGEITSVVAFVVAVSALAVAAGVVLDRTRSHRPVFSGTWAALVYALLALVIGAAATSTYSANDMLRDDWAPLVVGLVLLVLPPYRPAYELALATVGLTALAVIAALVQAPFAVTDVPLATFAVTGSAVLAALGFAASAYALSMNRSILQWGDRAWHSAAEAAVHQRGGVARSVQQRRVSLVNREVVPYLARISTATALTHDDREEARGLAQSIRALLVADVERVWAQNLLNEVVARVPGTRTHVVADDPDNVGSGLTAARRTLVRAIAMESVERVGASHIELRIRATPTSVAVHWNLTVPAGGASAVRLLAPVLHIVRGLTRRSRVEPRADGLTIEFHYGH
jgi:hypothetical protein